MARKKKEKKTEPSKEVEAPAVDDTVELPEENVETPSPDEMAEAGLIPDEPEESPPTEEAIPESDIVDPLEPLPTLEYLIRVGTEGYPGAGLSLEEARVVLAKLTKERISLLETRPHYRVKAPRKEGYWKAGRHFGPEETIVYLDELNEVQIREMNQANPLHLVVECVGFDPDEV